MSAQTNPVRWAIMGLGSQAATVAALLQGMTDMALFGVVSQSKPHVQAFAERFGVPHAATSLAALCEHVQPDALLICSPNYRHASESIDALRRGIPVLCEKPMALCAADAAQVAAEATRTGLLYGVGFHLRFHPLIRQAHAWVRAGKLGTLQALEAHWSVGQLDESTLRPLTDEHKQWRETMAQSGGGASQARGAHLFDLVRYVTDAHPTHITALHTPPNADQPDLTSMSMLRCSPSLLASITTSRLIPAAHNRLVLCGSRGTLELKNAFRPDGGGTLRFTNGQDDTEEVTVQGSRNLYTDELTAFSAALRGGAPWTGATAADGLAVTALMEAEWRSVRSGRTESVDATPIS